MQLDLLFYSHINWLLVLPNIKNSCKEGIYIIAVNLIVLKMKIEYNPKS